MTLIYKEQCGYFIDHRIYFKEFYKNVSVSEDETCSPCSYEVMLQLFCIVDDKKKLRRKRRLDSNEDHFEARTVKEVFDKFITNIPVAAKEALKAYNVTDKVSVRALSQNLFESTIFNHNGIHGGNNSSKPLKCKINEEFFLIPPNCRFNCGCVIEQCRKLSGQKFDLVIADPPWWNKYIRRIKSANSKLGYSMMYNEEISEIPVKDLLAPNSLVAVWCTNAPSNVTAIKDLIFPKWGVKYIATWYWVKVTTSLRPMCEFGDGLTKQPYERILLGTVGNVADVPDKKIIVSVPSALHSHKPPIFDLLSPYLDMKEPRKLELFARYLLPNTTSVGFEPLKWQHISLYEEVK